MITRNAVRCRRCGDEIESTHSHDLVACSCGTVIVDGGHDYLRRVWDGTGDVDIDDVAEELSTDDGEDVHS